MSALVRWSCVPGGFALLAFSGPRVQAASIDHKPVACVVAEQFPRLQARIDPADAIARAVVHFRSDPGRPWYVVAMEPDDSGTFSAVLPKPKKSLKTFQYYIDATDRAFASSRTPEQTTQVAGDRMECQGKTMAGTAGAVASILLEVPAGAAAIPAGFSSAGVVAAAGSTATAAGGGAAASSGGGGLGTGAIVGGVAAAAAAGAIVAVKALGEGGNPVEIEGQVFARNGSNPVVGAVVSTSLDGSTATTDGEGRFHLVTTTIVKRGECREYTITITAAGLPTYSVRGNWGSGFVKGQTFSLSPPGPAMIMSCP